MRLLFTKKQGLVFTSLNLIRALCPGTIDNHTIRSGKDNQSVNGSFASSQRRFSMIQLQM